jgi:hypothetical protein
VLWAHDEASTVRVEAVRFATCGCVMCWERVSPDPDRKMGVNARNFEPAALRSIRVVPLDGAAW